MGKTPNPQIMIEMQAEFYGNKERPNQSLTETGSSSSPYAVNSYRQFESKSQYDF